MASETFTVHCSECSVTVDLPVSTDGASISLGELQGWSFSTDTGWLCPKDAQKIRQEEKSLWAGDAVD